MAGLSGVSAGFAADPGSPAQEGGNLRSVAETLNLIFVELRVLNWQIAQAYGAPDDLEMMRSDPDIQLSNT